MSGLERNKYKIAGPQTWELVRAAYLAGDSARVVAERYAVTIAAIRRRANKEKWTKRHLAEALEARGIAPPPPPAAPDYIEPHIERATQRIAADAVREAEMTSLVERIAAEEDPADIAAAIERRALAQASAAIVQGRSKEAVALASMAEQMRKRTLAPPATPLVVQREMAMAGAALSPEELEKRALAQAGEALARGDAAEAKAMTAVAEQMRRRAEEAREAERAAADRVEVDRAQNEKTALEFFGMVAKVASHMVHEPGSAPAAFLRMIKRWRELNLGEGEAEAERRAAVMAEAHRAHLEDRWEDNLPEDVRAYMQARWRETRERLSR